MLAAVLLDSAGPIIAFVHGLANVERDPGETMVPARLTFASGLTKVTFVLKWVFCSSLF